MVPGTAEVVIRRRQADQAASCYSLLLELERLPEALEVARAAAVEITRHAPSRIRLRSEQQCIVPRHADMKHEVDMKAGVDGEFRVTPFGNQYPIRIVRIEPFAH